MLQQLKEQVLEANLEIVRRGLVLYTFGNASGIDRESGCVVIKPSGVPYESMAAADFVVTDLDGTILEGKLRPSSDLATHLALYRAFPQIGGVVHTHSRAATVWAQAGREIPCLGTTHADYFYGRIPVAGPLTAEEIRGEYELNTGLAIVRRFEGMNPLSMPAVLVAGHAPFAWGKDAAGAAYNAVVLEEVAELAWRTITLDPEAAPISQNLLDKHFLRKHGPDAYYGQK
ncbi:MAG TPA: L-ribulose-5-phosphate 4-epimerase [Bryobacteraceae bacterium]|jgi:L-ribulose-5-phosphate 4-epimerase